MACLNCDRLYIVMFFYVVKLSSASLLLPCRACEICRCARPRRKNANTADFEYFYASIILFMSILIYYRRDRCLF